MGGSGDSSAEGDAVSAVLLRTVEGFVRFFDEGFGSYHVLTADAGNAQAYCYRNTGGPVLDAERMLLNGAAKTLGRRCGMERRQARHDEREFFASIAATDIGGVAPALHREKLGKLLQYRVAGLVSEVVIDLLEVVDVKHNEGERLGRSVAARQLLPEPLLKDPVVVEPGEAVML